MIMRDPIHVTKEAVIYGGGEGSNANILAGFVETYNHTFIFDDGGASILAVGSVLMILPVSWKDHPSWPYLGTFIAGFSTHWLFEIIGGNDYFCRQF